MRTCSALGPGPRPRRPRRAAAACHTGRPAPTRADRPAGISPSPHSQPEPAAGKGCRTCLGSALRLESRLDLQHRPPGARSQCFRRAASAGGCWGRAGGQLRGANRGIIKQKSSSSSGSTSGRRRPPGCSGRPPGGLRVAPDHPRAIPAAPHPGGGCFTTYTRPNRRTYRRNQPPPPVVGRLDPFPSFLQPVHRAQPPQHHA